MYLTLMQGYNAMPAQGQLSPEEKYAVIHYIRETFTKEYQPDAYIAADDAYMTAAEWPAPGGGAEGGVAMTGAEMKAAGIAIPVEGVMALKSSQVTDDSLMHLKKVAAAVSDTRLKQALLAICADADQAAFADELFAAREDSAQLFTLVTQPGRDHFQPALALLSQSAVDEFAQQLAAFAPSSLSSSSTILNGSEAN